MTITIIGIAWAYKKHGAHIHYSYQDNRVVGQAVKTTWLNNNTYPVQDIQIGSKYYAEVNDYFFSVFRAMDDNDKRG